MDNLYWKRSSIQPILVVYNKQTEVKIEIWFLKFFDLISGCGYKDILNKYKEIPQKVFGNPEFVLAIWNFQNKGEVYQKVDWLRDLT